MSGPSAIWAKRAVLSGVLLGATLLSYLGTSFWQARRAVRPGPSIVTTVPDNPFASVNGTHLIAFVLTASDCGWSNRPEVMDAFANLRKRMQVFHGASYTRVSVIGIAMDENLDDGLRFLAKIGNGKPGGAFDQIVVGGSWLNEEVVRFVWRDAVAKATSPQVLVIERPINTESYPSDSRIKVDRDRVVANKTGSKEIVRWLKERAPIDALVGQRRAEVAGVTPKS